jgi:ABC-type bacteriocin/lantibiotic exporter with double-glycine peptidase domain
VRFQKEDFDCGPASLVNAAAALGRKISIERAALFAGTSPKDGTDEKGILRALGRMGLEGEELHTSHQADAFRWLCQQIGLGRPVILAVEGDSHWASVVGVLGGDRVVYVDSADYRENRRENGTYVFSKRKLARLWKARREGTRKIPSYYGIAVKRKEPVSDPRSPQAARPRPRRGPDRDS